MNRELEEKEKELEEVLKRLEAEEEYRMQRITIDLSAALAAALEAAVKFTRPGK